LNHLRQRPEIRSPRIFEGGCDYHPSVQQIAWVDTESGESGELRLKHIEAAEQFYRELKKKEVSVRVGIEATGHWRWFEGLLGELNYELWAGNPAEIRAKRVRKQRNDRFDAQHILKLMLENNFPRIWVPTPENRDVRQLVLHRHRLVGMRTRVMNQLRQWSRDPRLGGFRCGGALAIPPCASEWTDHHMGNIGDNKVQFTLIPSSCCFC
jgi:Transposase